MHDGLVLERVISNTVELRKISAGRRPIERESTTPDILRQALLEACLGTEDPPTI